MKTSCLVCACFCDGVHLTHSLHPQGQQLFDTKYRNVMNAVQLEADLKTFPGGDSVEGISITDNKIMCNALFVMGNDLLSHVMPQLVREVQL